MSHTRFRFEGGVAASRLGLLKTAFVLVLMIACNIGAPDEPPPDAWLEIGGQRIWIEIADTAEKQSLGLGQRDSLAWDHGMYFEYSQSGFYTYWMKGMRFSIDIVWLRNDRIVGFETNIPFEEDGNGPTVRPRELIDAVLEVPAGYSAANGWQIGDAVRLERIETR